MFILGALRRVSILDWNNLENIHSQIWSTQVQNPHLSFKGVPLNVAVTRHATAEQVTKLVIASEGGE